MDLALAPPTPRWRGRIHQVAFFVAVPAAALLVVLASGPAATAVATVYAVALIGLLGSSAAYHRGRWSGTARRWMKRLDHSMIFVLIAASYTPVAVLALGGVWEIVLLSVAWLGAVAGVTLKMARPDGFPVLGGVLYMALGWLAVVALPPLLRGLSGAEAALMTAEGLLYTAGAIVFATRRPDPRPQTFGYHEVWHAFMVAAAACHYVLILLLIHAG